MRQAHRLLLATTLLTATGPALAEPMAETCADGVCSIRVTAAQMLDQASGLVNARRFDEAKPLVTLLSQVPALKLETQFLAGYIAVETGDLESAIAHFRSALAANPKATRVRLELARVMMMQGKDGAADYNFRLAEEDEALPPEIRATVRQSRGLLRDRKRWHLDFNVGVAPDTNITNGTDAESVDFNLGNQTIPLALDGNARRRSGIGQTGSISAGYRFKLGDRFALLADIDALGVNYEGKSADDYTGQFAFGPELRFGDATMLSVQAIGSQRWYGGTRAAAQYGARTSIQHSASNSDRIGLSIDARHNDSGFLRDYDGWNLGVYASYERIVARSMVASVNLFARADMLRNDAYSGREYGINLGFGGELPFGVNAGISGGVSRMKYDAPLLAFSSEPRRDWRYNARAYAGLRSVRVLGFSPSVTYSFSRNDSSLMLYKSDRSRVAFNLARYF